MDSECGILHEAAWSGAAMSSQSPQHQAKKLPPGFLALSEDDYSSVVKAEPIENFYQVHPTPISAGQFASVRKCRRLSSGEEFAAKFCDKSRLGVDFTQEIQHEVAAMWAARGCSRVVQLQHLFETEQQFILVMELGPGGDLQGVLDDNQVPFEVDVVRFIRDLLEGLVFLHQQNIAHMDIKPQNLVLTGTFPDCEVKLCDLEVSRVIRPDQAVREMLGTPDYVAPEVLGFDPVTLAADIWSLGVLSYVLLTGFTPFGGDTDAETFSNIVQGELEFPQQLFEDVSDVAKDFVRCCLRKLPSERPSSEQLLQHRWLQPQATPIAPPALSTSLSVPRDPQLTPGAYGHSTLRRSISKSREALCSKISKSNLKKNISKSRERLCDPKLTSTKSGRVDQIRPPVRVSRSPLDVGGRPPGKDIDVPSKAPVINILPAHDQTNSPATAAVRSTICKSSKPAGPSERKNSLLGRRKNPCTQLEATSSPPSHSNMVRHDAWQSQPRSRPKSEEECLKMPSQPETKKLCGPQVHSQIQAGEDAIAADNKTTSPRSSKSPSPPPSTWSARRSSLSTSPSLSMCGRRRSSESASALPYTHITRRSSQAASPIPSTYATRRESKSSTPLPPSVTTRRSSQPTSSSPFTFNARRSSQSSPLSSSISTRKSSDSTAPPPPAPTKRKGAQSSPSVSSSTNGRRSSQSASPPTSCVSTRRSSASIPSVPSSGNARRISAVISPLPSSFPTRRSSQSVLPSAAAISSQSATMPGLPGTSQIAPLPTLDVNVKAEKARMSPESCHNMQQIASSSQDPVRNSMADSARQRRHSRHSSAIRSSTTANEVCPLTQGSSPMRRRASVAVQSPVLNGRNGVAPPKRQASVPLITHHTDGKSRTPPPASDDVADPHRLPSTRDDNEARCENSVRNRRKKSSKTTHSPLSVRLVDQKVLQPRSEVGSTSQSNLSDSSGVMTRSALLAHDRTNSQYSGDGKKMAASTDDRLQVMDSLHPKRGSSQRRRQPVQSRSSSLSSGIGSSSSISSSSSSINSIGTVCSSVFGNDSVSDCSESTDDRPTRAFSNEESRAVGKCCVPSNASRRRSTACDRSVGR